MSQKPVTGRSTIWNRLAWFLLLAVFATNVYRAVTQSITIDEAYTYLKFVSKPFAGLFEPFDANNHVLNTLLERLSVAIFGVSEWSLRLPSLIGGAIYLVVTCRICFLLFGGGLCSLLTTALLTTNPFVLDYLSAARGYGLALAFLLLAIYGLIRAMATRHGGYLYLAGISSGLSIAAHLTSVFPIAAVTAAFIVVNAKTGSLRLKPLWDELAVPAILVCFALLVLPLSKAQPGDFYFGAMRLTDTVHNVAALLFTAIPVPWLRGFGFLLNILSAALLPLSLLLLAICLAYGLSYLWKSSAFRDNPSDARLALFALAFLLVVGLVIAAHRFARLPYPLSRTALYFVPLAVLAAAGFCHRFRQIRVVSISAGLVSMLFVASFAAQANVSFYADWRYDAGARRIVNFIRSQNMRQKHLIVRASWPLEPSLNFYRLLYKLDWDPIDRRGPEQPGDIVVLTADKADLAQKHGWRIIYKDAVSAAIIAIPY
jgi:uncharacterized membrane protein